MTASRAGRGEILRPSHRGWGLTVGFWGGFLLMVALIILSALAAGHDHPGASAILWPLDAGMLVVLAIGAFAFYRVAASPTIEARNGRLRFRVLGIAAGHVALWQLGYVRRQCSVPVNKLGRPLRPQPQLRFVGQAGGILRLVQSSAYDPRDVQNFFAALGIELRDYGAVVSDSEDSVTYYDETSDWTLVVSKPSGRITRVQTGRPGAAGD